MPQSKIRKQQRAVALIAQAIAHHQRVLDEYTAPTDVERRKRAEAKIVRLTNTKLYTERAMRHSGGVI